MDLSVLRRTAAEIAAAAVHEIYPEIELWGGGETATGFFYDFYFPHPIHAHIVEERIRQIISEKRAIRTLEMVPFSAGELLKKEGHHVRVEGIGEGLVEIVQIGSFYDLSPGPHLKNTAELAAFKISMAPLPDKGMRLVGWCHRSKGELREFLKKVKGYVEPVQLGEQRGLWKGAIWLPMGLKLRQQLISFLKKELFADAMEIAVPSGEDWTVLHRSLGKAKTAEISSLSSAQTEVRLSFFGQSEPEWISSLQSIGKTLTILGFDHSAISTERGIDYWVEDGLGRSHPLAQVKKISKKGVSVVDSICTIGVEKILELLLEKNPMVELENQ